MIQLSEDTGYIIMDNKLQVYLIYYDENDGSLEIKSLSFFDVINDNGPQKTSIYSDTISTGYTIADITIYNDYIGILFYYGDSGQLKFSKMKMIQVGMNRSPVDSVDNDCLSVTIKAIGEQRQTHESTETEIWSPYSITYSNNFIVHPPKE